MKNVSGRSRVPGFFGSARRTVNGYEKFTVQKISGYTLSTMRNKSPLVVAFLLLQALLPVRQPSFLIPVSWVATKHRRPAAPVPELAFSRSIRLHKI